MSFSPAMSPGFVSPIRPPLTQPPLGLPAAAGFPNVIVGPGVSAGAPYTVVIDGDVYTVSRNAGTFIPGMVRFTMQTVIGKTYRFQIFNPVATPPPHAKFSMRKSDDAAGFSNTVSGAELEAVLEFTATATTTFMGISPTSNANGVVQFERPECRLVG